MIKFAKKFKQNNNFGKNSLMLLDHFATEFTMPLFFSSDFLEKESLESKNRKFPDLGRAECLEFDRL